MAASHSLIWNILLMFVTAIAAYGMVSVLVKMQPRLKHSRYPRLACFLFAHIFLAGVPVGLSSLFAVFFLDDNSPLVSIGLGYSMATVVGLFIIFPGISGLPLPFLSTLGTKGKKLDHYTRLGIRSIFGTTALIVLIILIWGVLTQFGQ